MEPCSLVIRYFIDVLDSQKCLNTLIQTTAATNMGLHVQLFIKYTHPRDFTSHKPVHRNFPPRLSPGAALPWALNNYSTPSELNNYSAPTAEHHQHSGERKLRCNNVRVVKSTEVRDFNA